VTEAELRARPGREVSESLLRALRNAGEPLPLPEPAEEFGDRGVPVAFEAALAAEFDRLMVRKLGAPGNADFGQAADEEVEAQRFGNRKLAPLE